MLFRSAMLLSVIVMGEAMEWRHFAGMGLVLVAIIVAATAERKS